MTLSNDPSVTVSAILEYFTPPSDGSRAYTYINADPITKLRKKNWEESKIVKHIENIRGKESKDEFTLDSTGFQFFKHHTKLKPEDFDNDQIIQDVYYQEQADLIKKYTGASKVLIFDHTIRKNHPDRADDTPTTRTPVTYVHVDQTPASTVARIHRHLPPEEAKERVKRRYQIINLWRPIAYTALDRPLALCDFRSINLDRDLEPQALIYPDREGETWGVKDHEDHRWVYLKGMTTEEFVLIKCGDSIKDGSVALCTPHTSFADPTTPKEAEPRESIELRALVFYD